MKTDPKLPEDWLTFLNAEIAQNYYNIIIEKINIEYEKNICFPPKNLIYNAFQSTNVDNLKIVIIGQDPYHGESEANGLAFSVNDGIKIPPSLRNIFKEINSDLNLPHDFNGNLERWASQGILLLNTTLTVQKDKANSHKTIGWQHFTNAVIKTISDQKSNIIFMLWGNFAIQKSILIDERKHLILKSGHPSPMSANQGKWFGNKHFSKANAYLLEHQQTEIDW